MRAAQLRYKVADFAVTSALRLWVLLVGEKDGLTLDTWVGHRAERQHVTLLFDLKREEQV